MKRKIRLTALLTVAAACGNAAAGLIDAFYTFGQTADYVLLDHREYIMVYAPEITECGTRNADSDTLPVQSGGAFFALENRYCA